MEKYLITVITQNGIGVLYKISDIFLKRKINIESLTVSTSLRAEIARFTIVVYVDRNTVEKVTKQLYRIVEVYKVYENKATDTFNKEIALVKINASNPQKRLLIEEQVRVFQGKIVFSDEKSIVAEKTGTTEEVDTLINAIKIFGIVDFVRSGEIALSKKEEEKSALKRKTAFYTSFISGSIIRNIQQYAQTKGDVISFAQGIPVFPTPKVIKDEVKQAIDQDMVDFYTPGQGIKELKQALAKKIKSDNKVEAVPDEIIVTHGATEAMIAILMTFFDKNDEVIVITPDYATHFSQIIIAQKGIYLKEVAMEESEKGWRLDLDRLENAISQKTKAIIFTNPNNPTGKVFSKQELEGILFLAKKYNLFVITDEIYEYFVFDGKKHYSLAAFPQAKEQVITIFGASKSYSMTGWRIGYIFANRDLINEIYKIHDNLIVCPTAVSQYALLAALKHGRKITDFFCEEYAKRREVVYRYLSQTDKLTYSPVDGSYYIFPKIKKETDDYSLAFRMIEKAKVAVVPGSAFGITGKNHFRISFAGKINELEEGLARLVNFFNSY
jgi:aminotransferase